MTTIDLRHLFGPTRDQGTRPTCLAFAMSDAHRVAQGLTHALSADYVHYHATRRDGSKLDEAATVTSMIDAVQHDGQPHEDDCPYCDPRVHAWTPPSGLKVWQRASRNLTGAPSSIVRAELDAFRPMVLSLWITESFFTPDATTFTVSNDNSTRAGEHAVVVVGARDDGAGNTEAFLVRNSWGDQWGDSGHAWLATDYVDDNVTALVRFEG